MFTRQTNLSRTRLAVFTRQKLTWVSFNPGRTRVSLYHVNRALEIFRFNYEYEFGYEYDFLETFRLDYEYKFDHGYDFLETFRLDYVYEFDYEYDFLET